jgi:hypothetical protein
MYVTWTPAVGLGAWVGQHALDQSLELVELQAAPGGELAGMADQRTWLSYR